MTFTNMVEIFVIAAMQNYHSVLLYRDILLLLTSVASFSPTATLQQWRPFTSLYLFNEPLQRFQSMIY